MAVQQVARVGLPARLPSGFRCHVGMAPTSAAGGVPGDTLPPALPRALPPRWGEAGELGNPLGSRAGTPIGSTAMAGERGAATESTRRARGYGRPHQVRDRLFSGSLGARQFSAAANLEIGHGVPQRKEPLRRAASRYRPMYSRHTAVS
jgi:hypothetical protein